MSLITTFNLAKSFGAEDVFSGISISVANRARIGLVGPNGVGKTTLLRIILGLEEPSAGVVHTAKGLSMGYLPQEASIFRKLNVQENVRAVLELQHDVDGHALSEPEIASRLDELLKDLRVDHLRDSPAPALSGGERRRVEIARALATRPRFILLDEPFAGIDPIAVLEIQHIIGFLKSRGIGVLITDHNVRETLGICDHAYIISDGHVLASGTTAEIIENAEVRRVYLGENFRM
ncbi:MAG: LPS export ABC transporter ATP-binding protein [Hydrogenophaga sp.]|nr:LPS export ABC transporter ATP-binding protein [Hydrogenophaga sp.]